MNVYVLEILFSGDTYVFEKIEAAREFTVVKIKEYYTDEDEALELIEELNEEYLKYGDYFDIGEVTCFKVPFIQGEEI